MFKPIMLEEFTVIKPTRIQFDQADQNKVNKNAYTDALSKIDQEAIESRVSFTTSSVPEINRDVPQPESA